MSVTVIGACSLCGGRVTVPAFWLGIVPPTPTCEQCGAVEAPRLPVIPMQPAPMHAPATQDIRIDWTGGRHRTWSTGGMMFALLLTLALATGCSARTPEGYEISIGGGSASSPAVVAPTGPAAATYDAGDATVNALVHQIVLAARRFDWRGFRQGCANAQEYAKGRERAGVPASVADKDPPAVAGVRERADEAFWQEFER